MIEYGSVGKNIVIEPFFVLNKELNPEKLARWRLVEAKVEGLRDVYGTEVDPGIKHAVVALNAVGISTISSCQGHIESGRIRSPFISVASAEAQQAAYDAFELGYKIGDMGVYERLKAKSRGLNEIIEKQLAVYLSEFYVDRDIDSFSRLVLSRNELYGNLTLHSIGAEELITNPNEDRLRLYQVEMESFAKFLRDKFFKDD